MKSSLLLVSFYMINLYCCKAQVINIHHRKEPLLQLNSAVFKDSSNYYIHFNHRFANYHYTNTFYNFLITGYSPLDNFPKKEIRNSNQTPIRVVYDIPETAQNKIIVNYKTPNTIRYLLAPNRHLYFDSKTLDRGRPKVPYYMMENKNRYDFLYSLKKDERDQ